uniref:Ornithine cyclodeaminase n=1 Tax=Picea sitchensis TaxID=3332 RepID=A9P0U7_PICSI|nr:unknown [Picea sitchensis]
MGHQQNQIQQQHHLQKCIIIDSDQVRTLLTESILIHHLQSSLSNDTIHCPQRQNLCINNNTNRNAPPGQLLVMPAWSQSPAIPYIGVKLVTAFPHNTHMGLPGINASYLLSDSFTGSPLAFVDGTEITHWRTSCISALKEAGELVGAFCRGLLRPEDVVGTLAELVRGSKGGRSRSEEVTVFKSVGSAVVDLVTAQFIYEKHLQGSSD